MVETVRIPIECYLKQLHWHTHRRRNYPQHTYFILLLFKEQCPKAGNIQTNESDQIHHNVVVVLSQLNAIREDLLVQQCLQESVIAKTETNALIHIYIYNIYCEAAISKFYFLLCKN